MFKNYLYKKDFNLNLFKNFLIFITPFLAVLGPFFPDLIISLASIYLILNYKNFDTQKIFYSKFFIFMILFWIYLIINSFNSENLFVSFKSTLPYIRFILFIFFIKIFFDNKNSLKILLISFSFLYILLLGDSIFQLNFGYNIFGYTLDASGRVSSFFKDELILGSFISKTFAVILFLIFFLNIKYKYFFYIIAILVSGFLIYISRERSALFVFFLIFFFSMFLIEKKYFLRTFLLTFSLMSVTFLMNTNPIERIYFHTIKQFNETKGFFPSSRHYLHYLTAYKIFGEKPIIGGGVKSFRYLCDKDSFKPSEEDLIILSNGHYSTIDGYFYSSIIKSSKISTFVFPANFYNKYKSHLNNKNELSVLVNSNEIINKYHFQAKDFELNNFQKIHIKNGEFIKKDTLLMNSYPYKNGCSTHPHNFYLQILSELGLIGFIFLIFFYIYILKGFFIRIYDYIRNNKISEEIVIYGFYVAVFFPLLTSGNFFNNYISILIYFPFSFIILCLKK